MSKAEGTEGMMGRKTTFSEVADPAAEIGPVPEEGTTEQVFTSKGMYAGDVVLENGLWRAYDVLGPDDTGEEQMGVLGSFPTKREAKGAILKSFGEVVWPF